MPPKAITAYFKPAGGSITGTAATATNAGASSKKPRAKSTLSDAARKAILSSKDDNGSDNTPPAKRAKLSNGVSSNGISSQLPSIVIPKANSREELREALKAHPKAFSLLKLELDTLGEDWLLSLQEELTKPYFLALKEFVIGEQTSKKVFPPPEDIYSWSRFCPLKDVRVIIVGQDPYHDDGQAHGLAFSVRKGVRIPPSLRNIYKEMTTSVSGFVAPTHGDLTEWAKHGVLLLNTSLTVRAHEAASHSNRGWEQFTQAVLRVATSNEATTGNESTDGTEDRQGLVLMAWGAHASKVIAGLDTKRHLVLRSAHPSPLSASRGFFGNGHFVKSNKWLEERYGPQGGVDWKSLGA